MTTATKKQPNTMSSIEAQEAFEKGKPVMNSLGEIYTLSLESNSTSLSFQDTPKDLRVILEKPNFNLHPSGWVIVED